MRVTGLQIHEVGPIRDLDITFQAGSDDTKADTVLFVGPNGSGKSTLLYAIAGCFDPLPELRERMWRGDGSIVEMAIEHAGQISGFRAGGQPEPMGAAVDLALLYPLYAGEQVQGLPYAEQVGRYRNAGAAYYVFAYSGTRTFEPGGLTAAPDSTAHVRFNSPGSFDAFRNWVSDILGRRDAATVQQQPTAAANVSAGLRRLEDFLTKVTGRPQHFVRNIDNGEILLDDGTTRVPLYVLPEGLKSMLGWMGDLLRRLYSMDPDGKPHHELPIVVLLDEIEVHLHPKWQRLIVPAVEQLLPNAQIFLATHSPFVLASASDAQIVWLPEPGSPMPTDLPTDSLRGLPYTAVLELMGITSFHDEETARGLAALDAVAAQIRAGEATLSDFEACAIGLPKTEDVVLTVDFQRSQLKQFRMGAAS
jgi:energy-coupling factor transporter ATP-binding protein EcfA2